MTQSNENATAQQPAQQLPVGLIGAYGFEVANDRLAKLFRIIERVDGDNWLAETIVNEHGHNGELVWLTSYDLRNNCNLFNDVRAYALAVNKVCEAEGRQPLFVEQKEETAE